MMKQSLQISFLVGDGEKLSEFDHSKFNCIVFDEIYMNSLYILNRIREFVNQSQ